MLEITGEGTLRDVRAICACMPTYMCCNPYAGIISTIILIAIDFFCVDFVTLLGYWHQRADERHGNPSPR